MQIWRSASLPHQLTNTWRLTGRHAVSTLSSLSPVQTGVLSHPLADHLIIELVRGQINIFFTSQFIFALVCQPSQRHASEAQNDCREWKGGEIHKWCRITERTQVSGEVWTSVTGKNRNTHTFSAPLNFLCVGGKQTPVKLTWSLWKCASLSLWTQLNYYKGLVVPLQKPISDVTLVLSIFFFFFYLLF